MEKQQASDPNYPKLIVPIPVFRKMIDANSALEKQFMAEMERHKADVLDSARMAVVWEAQWEKFQETLGQALGILSLTEDPTHPLMWSHYASQHFGVVVEFDQSHPWFNQKIAHSDDFRHLVKVAYEQEPLPRTWKQLKANEVLYTKSIEWAYEREWRVIRPLKDGTEVSPGKICFEVPPEAVRSITFGCRTTPALEKQIRDLVAANPNLGHVRFRKAKLAAGGKIGIEDA